MEGKKPFFILLSAIDIRDENKIPEHYVRNILWYRQA
jgi:hypothetical protein